MAVTAATSTTAGADERTRIMQAAYAALASAHGGPISVNEVLGLAGLSTRAFYRHFGSKDELIVALLHQDADQVLLRVEQTANATPDPTAALIAWIVEMLEVTSRPNLRRRALVLVSEQARQVRGSRAERRRFMAEQNAGIQRILERGRASGSFPLTNPATDAKLICAAIREAFEDHLAGVTTASAQETATEIVSFALRALGAPR